VLLPVGAAASLFLDGWASIPTAGRHTVAEIAAEFGVSCPTINRYLDTTPSST
jgi:hypothetical protein